MILFIFMKYDYHVRGPKVRRKLKEKFLIFADIVEMSGAETDPGSISSPHGWMFSIISLPRLQ